jgi:capsular polysaccharide export protein
MIAGGLRAFAGKSVLLLQGPVGPFFRRLAVDLRAVGAIVHKVNFNAGDWLFYGSADLEYRGTLESWPAAMEDLIDRWQIQVVLVFGDCRPIHHLARHVVLARGLEFGVFEEGYVRPDYITLERYGVNGYSRLPREPGRYRSLERTPPDRPQPVGVAYWHAVLWAALYGIGANLGAWRYPHYRHHRPLDAVEALRWARSAWRKWQYRMTEWGLIGKLLGQARGRYFLVALQVHNDAQVHTHSSVGSVPQFIEATMRSFAAHAPQDAWIVLKHHPMDRAYAQYGVLIRRLAHELGLTERCLYLHDQHLPTLLENAGGVVLINSTVGLQALHHERAVKVCGEALFDIAGLTYRGTLDSFWLDAPGFRPDMELLERFQQYLVSTTQINGSYYRRLSGSDLHTGIRWQPGEVAPTVGIAGRGSQAEQPPVDAWSPAPEAVSG